MLRIGYVLSGLVLVGLCFLLFSVSPILGVLGIVGLFLIQGKTERALEEEVAKRKVQDIVARTTKK